MIEQLSQSGESCVSVHLVVGGLGSSSLACMSMARDLTRLPQHNLMRTDDPRAVTCPACKRALGIKG